MARKFLSSCQLHQFAVTPWDSEFRVIPKYFLNAVMISPCPGNREWQQMRQIHLTSDQICLITHTQTYYHHDHLFRIEVWETCPEATSALKTTLILLITGFF